MADSEGGRSRRNKSQSVPQSEPDDPGSQTGSDAAVKVNLRYPTR